MKIGALCFENLANPHYIAKEFHSKGIKVVELGYNNKFTPHEIKRIKEYNLNLSLHCPFEDLRLKYSFFSLISNKSYFCFPKSAIKEIEKSFSAAEKLEATHYVLHGGSFPRGYFRFKKLRQEKKFIDAFIRGFKPLFMRAKDSGVKIALENLTQGQIFTKISDIKKVKKEFGWLGICLDFAHSELTHQTDLLRDLELDHVHISDNDGINDLHLAVGQGRLDFVKLFNLLRNKDYNGKVIVECKTIQDAIESLDYIKRNFF